ncbi:MAG: hypothetical protein V1810_02920 [Candidatus Beckwithbacteria bacterium]
MGFYRDSVTAKSWQLLKILKQQYQFCLIGGWAVWLYTKKLKSKDIDIVVDLNQLAKLKQDYDLFKNERLKKYELKQGEVDVDIYAPFYSEIGIKAEEILEDMLVVSGFTVPSPELLFNLKLNAWLDRRISAKGRKDLIDLAALLETQKLDRRKLQNKGLKILVKELRLLPSLTEINLNQHYLSRAKKKWLFFLDT